MAQCLGSQTRPVFTILKHTVEDIITVIDTGLSVDTLEYKIDWVKIVLQQLSLVENVPQAVEIISILQTAKSDLAEITTEPAPLFGRNTCTCSRGRPAFQIPKESLEGLLEMHFSVPTIAHLVGVSVRTIRNRMSQYELSVKDFYSYIDNNDLDQEVLAILHNFPNTGYKQMMGHLKSAGVRLTENRVREAMRRVDPVGVLDRSLCLRTIRRRKYSVACPNALWHIDGHHKIIRWKFVTHGCIDGFSRKIIFLHCSTNNKADTVLDLFRKGTTEFGVPLRVRGDRGVENVHVARFMIDQRGAGGYIAGTSVHNTRIERLWRDVFHCVISLYYNLFSHLEGIGILDTEADLQLWALHYVFIPRINAHLESFASAYGNHPLSTERNRTPNQLWVEGLEAAAGRNAALVQDLLGTRTEENSDGVYGLDPQGPVPDTCDGESTVLDLSNIDCPLSAEDLMDLSRVVDPLEESDGFGVDLYERTLLYLNDLVA